ncbi:hypothetical protein B0H13DRAFT_2319918 [Mycena leptocephala]|nr:hypothetical protein B0H13DRAFT_2319918 [Mycena leptocephala]
MALGHNSFGNLSSARQYKLPELLKVYYNGDWKSNSNIKQTKATTADVRRPRLQQIHDPERMKMVPRVPQTIMRLHDALRGMLALPTESDRVMPDPPALPDLTPDSPVAGRLQQRSQPRSLLPVPAVPYILLPRSHCQPYGLSRRYKRNTSISGFFQNAVLTQFYRCSSGGKKTTADPDLSQVRPSKS